MKCLYCKQEFEPNNGEYCQKYEGCPECEKKSNEITEQLTKMIVSVPAELRHALFKIGVRK